MSTSMSISSTGNNHAGSRAGAESIDAAFEYHGAGTDTDTDVEAAKGTSQTDAYANSIVNNDDSVPCGSGRNLHANANPNANTNANANTNSINDDAGGNSGSNVHADYSNFLHPSPHHPHRPHAGGANVAGGFRRLHRDYLRDLEDDVVLSLPWPTPSDRLGVSEVLQGRAAARARANKVSAFVVAYWIVSVVAWLLYGMVLGAGDRKGGKGSSSKESTSAHGRATVLLGVSCAASLAGLLWAHYWYYKLDGRVQAKVRAIMDANGLGYREEAPRLAPSPLHRDDPAQAARFKLPEFVDVVLRSVAEEGSGEGSAGIHRPHDDDFSALTFRDSLIRSVASGSAGSQQPHGRFASAFSLPRKIWGGQQASH